MNCIRIDAVAEMLRSAGLTGLRAAWLDCRHRFGSHHCEPIDAYARRLVASNLRELRARQRDNPQQTPRSVLRAFYPDYATRDE